MNSYELPIFKSALDLCVYVDTIVKNQDKYHKYGIGSELREATREMFYLVSKINTNKERKIVLLQALIDKCEETKAMLYLAKSLRAFKSFNAWIVNFNSGNQNNNNKNNNNYVRCVRAGE